MISTPPHTRGDSLPGWQPFHRLHFNPLPSCEGRRDNARKLRQWTQFQSTPPHTRGRPGRRYILMLRRTFQSTLLIRGRLDRRITCTAGTYFNPLPHTRGDGFDIVNTLFTDIQSTPLMRGETAAMDGRTSNRNFNPLPSHEGDHRPIRVRLPDAISIAPLTRGDAVGFQRQLPADISIHSLIRGETRRVTEQQQKVYISIHSPHTRGRRTPCAAVSRLVISIPSYEGDEISVICGRRNNFNPLPSSRETR